MIRGIMGKVIICLSGPDGSGKSTLTRLLMTYLARCGSVRSSWLRGSHMAASLLARFLSMFRSVRGLDNPYYGISIPRSLRPLWWFLEFVSVIPHWLLHYLLPSTYEVVIGERGLLDFITWVCVTTDIGFIRTLWARAVMAMAIKYCRNTLITASLETLIARKGGEATARTLPRQWVIYGVLSRALGLTVIDTTRERPTRSLARLIRALGISC